MTKHLIIGAGPAGLATAVALKLANIPFEIVDAGNKVGGIWDITREETPMYKSAHFISSKTLSGFRDFPMPEDYPDYPNHSLIQSYIEAYAEHHNLADYARFNTRVLKVAPNNQHWEVTFDNDTTHFYKGVICATGITWHLNLPEIEGEFEGEYMHSFQYKEPSIFQGKKVLVIGAGNSGCDIACDAAKNADKAFISLRRGYYFLPKYTFGLPSDLFKEKFRIPNKYLDNKLSEFFLNKILVGNLENYGLPKPDHNLMESHPILNNRLIHHLGHGDITAKKDVSAYHGKKVTFEDGSEEEIDLIIAATGYKRAFPFLAEGLIDTTKKGKEIDLYLEIFSKQFDNLFFVGGIEVSSAVFGLFGLQGGVIAAYLKAQKTDNSAYQNFLYQKKTRFLNLKGKNNYVNSLRHQRYVDKEVYRKVLKKELGKFDH